MRARDRWLVGGFVLLVANSAYLQATASATLFYAANVLSHVGLGLGLALLALPAAKRGLAAPGLGRRLAVLLLALAAASGLVLVLVGNLRPQRPVLVAHIVAGTAGAWLAAVALGRRGLVAAVALATALAAGFVVRAELAEPERPEVNRALPPPDMAGEAMGGADGPFFPSSAATKHGGLVPSRFFLESATCGEAGCHPDIYAQWESSAHRRASFNNQWYRKSVEYMQSVVGTTPSKWCGGCHDHALLFSGLMDRPVAELLDLPEAHAGLACTSCHSIVAVESTMGNGDFVLEVPELHDLATSENPWVRALHDFVLRLDPEPHRRTFLKPFHQGDNAAFCSTCHKVHLDVPVNGYRWIRGFNEYDNWQASGVSGQGARSFYYPPEPMSCSDCHMPLVASSDAGNRNGRVHSHRFAAANTALAVAYRDEAQLEAVTDFLRAGQVTVDLFALVRGGAPATTEGPFPPAAGERRIASTFAVGEEAELAVAPRIGAAGPEETVVAPLDRRLPALVPGESVRIDAVVRTRNVGHFFPGGTVDAFDVWLELRAVDGRGRTIFWSGRVEDEGRGPVEPTAHFYRSLLLDAHGNPINKRNAWAARAVLYVNLIPPGAASTVRFRLEVPEDVAGPVDLHARLHYRKFSWWHTQWAYRGVRDPLEPVFDVTPDYDDGRWIFAGDTSDVSGLVKEVPDVPIVTMAEAKVRLPVAGADGAPADPPGPTATAAEDAWRWNDYGIGLLLQGDLRAAERAFGEVARLLPESPEGWVNVARVRVQEGDPEGALEALDRALSIAPDLPKAHYFSGLALKALGRYDEALEHFRRAAAAYPRDRVVRNQIGRIHFLKREFDRAVEEFTKTLAVDPEDLEAHYNLMLCYQGLGDMDKAERHRTLYLRFKADEASQFLTGEYRRLHPADNNERLPIHEHRSAHAGAEAGGSR